MNAFLTSKLFPEPFHFTLNFRNFVRSLDCFVFSFSIYINILHTITVLHISWLFSLFNITILILKRIPHDLMLWLAKQSSRLLASFVWIVVKCKKYNSKVTNWNYFVKHYQKYRSSIHNKCYIRYFINKGNQIRFTAAVG